MAKELDRRGFPVIAGCLNANSESVRQLCQQSSNVTAMQMDVTKLEEIHATKKWIQENIKGGKFQTKYIRL